jgi:hypothetical protein
MATAIPPQILQNLSTPSLSDDPFGGVAGAVSATQIDPTTEYLRIAILGLPKSGKSWFAATAPGPVLHYDFDNRAVSLAGKPDVYVKTLVDLNQKSPIVMKALEKDLSNFKYRKSKGMLIPKTFVFDTVTYLKGAIENECFAQDPGLARKIRVGVSTEILKGKSYDIISGVQGYMQYLVQEFGALGNLIVVFHERDQKDKDKSTKDETVYTGKVTVDPQYLENLLTLFNEVFRIQVKGGIGATAPKYIVTCRPSYDVNAASTLLIDGEEPPNIVEMLAKHKRNLAAKAAK